MFSPLQMVFAAKKKAYRLMLPIRCFLLLPIQDTALLTGAAYPFWTCVRGPTEPNDRPRAPASVAPSLQCLERQDNMRSLCTNSTQGIQYPMRAYVYWVQNSIAVSIHFREDATFRDRQRRTPPLGTSSERESHREAIYSSTN